MYDKIEIEEQKRRKKIELVEKFIINPLSKIINLLDEIFTFTKGILKLIYGLMTEGLYPSPKCPECGEKIRGSETGKPTCKCVK